MKKIIHKKAFSLVELIVAIAIIGVLAVLWYNMFKWGGEAEDLVSQKALNEIAISLEDFKARYWSYPVSSSNWRNYPKDDCGVSWFETMISCLVAKDYITEWSDWYEKVAYDQTEGEYNDYWEEYDFYYWVNQYGNKFKLCSLARVQNNEKYKGLDGSDSEEWKRYICVASSNATLDEITSMNK